MQPDAAPILVGVDESPASVRAAAFAATLAAQLGCPILTCESGTPSTSMPTALHDTANQAQARFIVIGTRGQGWASRLFAGSPARRLLRETSRPILLTDFSERAGDDAPARAIGGVICGVDFKAGSLVAVRVAARLASDLGVALTLVHAIDTASLPPPGLVHVIRESDAEIIGARLRLDQIARELTPAPVLVVQPGPPAAVLANESEQLRDAVVVVGLGTSGHRRRGRIAIGVLARTKTAVMAVPE